MAILGRSRATPYQLVDPMAEICWCGVSSNLCNYRLWCSITNFRIHNLSCGTVNLTITGFHCADMPGDLPHWQSLWHVPEEIGRCAAAHRCDMCDLLQGHFVQSLPPCTRFAFWLAGLYVFNFFELTVYTQVHRQYFVPRHPWYFINANYCYRIINKINPTILR